MSAQSSSATPRSTTAAEANMRLDNTSQPSVKFCVDKVNAKYIHGRPEAELVPSRYALKVGAIDVMVISDGVLSLPGAMPTAAAGRGTCVNRSESDAVPQVQYH
jgi:hypothetical protein